MSDKWILDVLADMRAFAHKNQLPRLAETLDSAAVVAATELTDRDLIRSEKQAVSSR